MSVFPSEPIISAAEIRWLAALQNSAAGAAGPVEAVALVLREVCERCGWDFAQSWVPDEMEKRLDPGVFWMRDRRMQVYRDSSVSSETKYGIGLLWGAFMNRRPVLCLDFAKEPTFRRTAGARAAGLKGGLFVPVLDGQEAVGAIEFLMREPHAETGAMVGVATAAAKVAAPRMRVR